MNIVTDPVELELYLVISNDGKINCAETSKYWTNSRVDRLNEEYEGTGRKWSATLLKVSMPPDVFSNAFDDKEQPGIPMKFDFFKWFRR